VNRVAEKRNSRIFVRLGEVVAPLVLAVALTVSGVAVASEGEPEGHAAEGHATEAGEHGAGDHTPTIDIKKLGLQLVNFSVLLFILIKFGGGAINKALAARHQQLKADLAAASELKSLAEAKLAKQEARLGSLEQEIAEMRRVLKAEAEAEKARLIAAAEERSARIKTETSFLVEQQVREAESRLRRESAEAALKAAEEILRRVIGPADQKQLLDTFISDIERSAPRGGGPV
jgi:F-type H+-transporting ATPase subunit b